MKVNKFISLLIISLLIHIHSAKSKDNQQLICLTDRDCMSLYSPIIFAKGGLTKFLQQNFNKPEYAQDVLPNDFSHFIQCLDYTQKRYPTRIHGRHVMRLFTHKLRASTYVNAAAYSNMLAELMPIIKRYLDGAEQRVATTWKVSINKILYDAFLNQFDQFKSSPAAFFDSLSQDVTTSIFDQQALLGDITIDEFRHSLVRFLEMGLNKLIWHPEDGLATWLSANSIANSLVAMSNYDMLSADDIYELKDSLLERYCFFIDVVSQELPTSFFVSLKNDLANQRPSLLDDDELEACIESKRQRFVRALCEGEFHAKAIDQGLIIT
jgi:hypothetical protein